jgi:hypothetical protein
MIKATLLAALLGVSAALPQVTNYMYSNTLLPSNNYFQITYTWAGDAGYKSGYAGANQTTESYGFELYSYANVTLKFEYFTTYFNQYMFSFVPFDIYPYRQYLDYEPTVDGNGNP